MMALISLYKPQISENTQNTILKNLREFRYPLEKNAVIQFQDTEVIVRVKNISSTGVFIQTHMDHLAEGKEVILNLQMNSKLYRLKGKVVWINIAKKSSYLPIGIGIRFDQKFVDLSQEVQGWSLGA